MKVKVHNITGEPHTLGGLWMVPCLCEEDDGSMVTHQVTFATYDSVLGLQKYFRSPTIEPMELIV